MHSMLEYELERLHYGEIMDAADAEAMNDTAMDGISGGCRMYPVAGRNPVAAEHTESAASGKGSLLKRLLRL